MAPCRPAPTATGSHHNVWSNAPALSQRVKFPSPQRHARRLTGQQTARPARAGPAARRPHPRETDILGLITRGNSNTETTLPCAARTPHGTHEGSWSAVRVNSG